MIVAVCLPLLAPCSLLRVRLPSLPPCLPHKSRLPPALPAPPAASGGPCAPQWATQSPGPSSTWPSATRYCMYCLYCLVPLVLLVPMLLPDTACAQAASRPLICTAPAPNCTAPEPQDCGKPMYLGNYLAFFAAIRTRYPHMRLISNCDTGQDAPTDIWVSGAAVAVVGGGCGCAGGGYWWLVVMMVAVVMRRRLWWCAGGGGGACPATVAADAAGVLDGQRLRWQWAVGGAKGGGTGRTQGALAHPPPPALPGACTQRHPLILCVCGGGRTGTSTQIRQTCSTSARSLMGRRPRTPTSSSPQVGCWRWGC